MKNSKYFQIFLSILLVKYIRLQTTSYDVTYGVCSCDATNNYCDLNCCCDPDCSQADETAFQCPILTTSNSQKWCVPNSMLFTQNTPYIIESLAGLICLDINNSLSMNYYTPVLSESLDATNVNSLVEQYDPNVYQQSIINLQLDQTAAQFKTSDNIWIMTSGNYLGYLTLPVQVAGLQCRNGPPLKYLSQKKSSCITDSAQIDCANLAGTRFSIDYYTKMLEEFKIITKPSSIADCLKKLNTVSKNLDKFISCGTEFLTFIKLRNCKWNSGRTEVCTDTELPSLVNGLCQNMIRKITYVFEYENPSGYTGAHLDVELFDPTDLTKNTKIEQIFQVNFVPKSFDSSLPIPVSSGNPGYKVGKPVMVLSNSLTDPSILIDLNVLKFDTTGFCPISNEFRTPIKFGINMLSECKLSYPIPKTMADCTQLQMYIDNVLLGFDDSLRSVKYAPFANSLANETKPIINSNPVVDSVFADGTCKGLRLNLGIRIAFANEGNINNPQAKILYVGYDWTVLTDIEIRCQTPDCLNKYPKSLVLTTKITFVDVSQPPLYAESQINKPQATVPDNFFYPIGFSNASTSHHQLHSTLACLIAFIVVLFYN